MKNDTKAIVAALAILGLASLHAHEAAAQERPDAGLPAPGTMIDRPQIQGLQEPSLEPGAEVVAYELTWRKPESDTVVRRLAAATDVLLGTKAARALGSEEALYEALRPAVTGEEAGSWVRLEALPVLMKYDPEHDEIRVLYEELDAVEEAATSVDVDGVREVAEKVLAQLGESGVIDPRLYERAALQLGYRLTGDGPLDQEPKPGRIVGYRLTFRPRLSGFEMVNAGVRMGILTSGRLVSLRLGGVEPTEGWQQGAASGRREEVRVSTQDLMERFYRQVPEGAEAQVAWSRVMYVMPEGESRAVVAPRLLVSYSERRMLDDQPVVSRRKTLAYSLTDPDAPPIDFDAPAAKHEGTKLERQEPEGEKSAAD